jgi:hypothetical protein
MAHKTIKAMAIYQLNRSKTMKPIHFKIKALIYCNRWCLQKLSAAQNVITNQPPAPARGLKFSTLRDDSLLPPLLSAGTCAHPLFRQPAGRTFVLLSAQRHHLHIKSSSVLFSLAETIKAALLGANSSGTQRQMQTLKSFGEMGYKVPSRWPKTQFSHLFF